MAVIPLHSFWLAGDRPVLISTGRHWHADYSKMSEKLADKPFEERQTKGGSRTLCISYQHQ